MPVGLISTNYGGTPAEAWTDAEALAADPQLKPILDRPENERESHRPGWLYNAMIPRWSPSPSRGPSGTRASPTPAAPTSTAPSSPP